MPDATRGPVSGDLGRATPEVQKYRPRACQSCARSKMRCVWPSEPGATPCQRCSKIKSTCTLPEINPRRRRGPSTRVGQLEEKIDGIMSLLNASQQIQQNSPSSSGQTPPSTSSAVPALEQGGRSTIQQLLNPNVEANSGAAGSRPGEGPPLEANLHSQARLVPPAGLVPSAAIAAAAGAVADIDSPNLSSERATRPTAAGESVEIVKGFRVTFFEADRALNLYRTPFLFRSIVALTTPQSPAVQAEYRLWFREYVAQHVVVNNEKRLEILQAILIHLAWGDYYFLVDSQATNLIQLATALVIELGVNRWPLDYGKASFLMMKEAVPSGPKLPRSRQHTLDEMRASLGTFYVTSLCSTLFRRHQPMMFNSYLSKCCETLAEAQEYDSDKFLVATVKIQQLLNRGADIIPYTDEEAARRIQYTPAHMALTSIQKELEALLRDQPPEVECNALLWTHYHGTLCRLFEPVIYIRSTSAFGGGYETSEGTSRTAALWQCLHSARDFFSAFLVIPPQNLACMPFHSVHLSFCVLTATRLLVLGDDGVGGGGGAGDPDWNPALAREAVNFDAIYARIADFFDEADKICVGLGRRVRYLNQERSILAMHRDKVRWIRSWYVGRTRPAAPAPHPPSFAGYRADDDQDRRGPPPPGGGALSGSKDPGGDHLGPGGGPHGGSSSSSAGGSNPGPAAAHGQPMDVDYGASSQAPMPGDLDDSFWQAMFDWGWNGGMDLMEVQG